jgi:hypothetical protein
MASSQRVERALCLPLDVASIAKRSLALLPGSTSVWIVALALTLLNVAKPLVVDDAAFYQYARQIAESPTDPYGFELFWYDAPEPANRVLAPPVLLYWWAAAQRLFGDSPVAWKLLLLPFAVILCASLRRLLRIFAPGYEGVGIILVVISPAILPSFNLMLDIPALGLGLASFVVLINACNRERGTSVAMAAGLIGALAMQTKYTAVIPFAVSLVYALSLNRKTLGLLSGTVASSLFVAWEAFTMVRYGESHFVNGLRQVTEFPSGSAVQWLLANLDILGAASPVVGLLALVALRFRARWAIGVGTALTVAFAAIAVLPAPKLPSIGRTYPASYPGEPEQLILSLVGLFVFVTAGCALATWSLRSLGHTEGSESVEHDARRLDAVLLIWLALEVAGLFVLTPYPAIRRIIGVHVVLTIAILRAIRREGGSRSQSRDIRSVAAWGAALGILFAVSDISDARARHTAVNQALATLEGHNAGRKGETVWYVGHWGIQYYAEAAGLRPIVPGSSRLEPDDWVLFPQGVHTQAVQLPRYGMVQLTQFSRASASPWSTLPGIYAGYRPIRPQPDMQLLITLGRVEVAFTAGRVGEPTGDPTRPSFE